jgi:hypothetical protein
MRVTNTTPAQVRQDNLLVRSSREIAAFIKLSPEQHRKIAELICSISDRMGKQGIELLQDFTQSVAQGNLHEFSKRWAEKKIPMSILSDLLAVSQEMEANTREKVDALILKAKKGALQLGKHSLTKAVALLVL